MHFAVLHAAFETRGEYVGQHDERLFIHALRDVVEAAVGERDAYVFGLCAVHGVAQNPARLDAVARHASSAVVAGRAAGDAVDQNAISLLEASHAGSRLLDDPNTLLVSAPP